MAKLSITIRTKRGFVRLHLPIYFEEATSEHTRKAFKLLFENRFECEANTEMIQVLDMYIPDMVEEKKYIWKKAEEDFKNGYRDVTLYSRRDSSEIKAQNRELFTTAKSAKEAYEKAIRVQRDYFNIRNKYIE